MRALNGAALGALMGGLLGGGLGAASAFLVDALSAMLLIDIRHWARIWATCAVLGVIPGVPAGLVLGTTMIVRSDRRRWIIGTVTGSFAGGLYALFWSGAMGAPNVRGNNLAIGGQILVMTAIVGSGLMGGGGLSLGLTVIRRHWKWWSRWENDRL